MYDIWKLLGFTWTPFRIIYSQFSQMSYGPFFPATTRCCCRICFSGFWIPCYGSFVNMDLYENKYISIWGFEAPGFFGSIFFRHMYVGPGPFKVGVSMIFWVFWIHFYGSFLDMDLYENKYISIWGFEESGFFGSIFLTDICGSRTLQSGGIHDFWWVLDPFLWVLPGYGFLWK